MIGNLSSGTGFPRSRSCEHWLRASPYQVYSIAVDATMLQARRSLLYADLLPPGCVFSLRKSSDSSFPLPEAIRGPALETCCSESQIVEAFALCIAPHCPTDS